MTAVACSSASSAPDEGNTNAQGGSQQQPGSGGSASPGAGGTMSGPGPGGGGGGSAEVSDASTGPMVGPDATSTPGSYQTVQVFQTSRNAGAGSKSEHCDAVAPLTLHASGMSTRSVVTVDATKPKQKITGFGGAITEVAASTIAVLPADKQTEIYDAYFSAGGSGYTLTRTHIGSCDFSLAEYSYDDTKGDTALANFKIDYDQKYLVPALKKAAASSGNTLKILGSLWSAPAWMKSNNSLYDGVLNTANYPVFAQYLSKYVQSYKAAGLDIWAITPTNEPLGVGGSRESMVWTDAGMNTFIRDNLGPQFKKDGLSTQVFIFDHNKGPAASDATKWATTIFGDKATNAFVAGSAVHWYGSTFSVYEDGLDALHGVDANKDILFDEGTADGFIFNSSVATVKTAPWFQNDDWYWKKDDYDWGYVYADKMVHPPYQPVNRYARDIIVGLNHWYTGWIDWNAVLNKFGALDAKGGGLGNVGDPGVSHIENGVPAGIMVDEANPAAPVIYYTPIFYVMRHFSKFIHPGAKVMTTTVTLAAGVAKTDYDNTPTQDGQALLAVGAQNPDGTTAAVLFNETGKPIDYSVVVGAQTADGTIPAQAVQTLVFK
jgi:glucosylceramidase